MCVASGRIFVNLGGIAETLSLCPKNRTKTFFVFLEDYTMGILRWRKENRSRGILSNRIYNQKFVKKGYYPDKITNINNIE